MIALRNALVGNRKKLPYDAEVEYLESTGTQWIDTDYKLATPNAMRVILDFTSIAQNSQRNIFGSDDATGFNIYFQKETSFGFYLCGTYVLQNVPISQGVRSVLDVTVPEGNNSGVVIYEGVSYNTSPRQHVQSSTNFFIFTQVPEIARTSKLRVFSCSIFDDGILVRNLQPVRFTNELGQSEGAMYDRVSGQLFRNQGTGAFLFGQDKIPPIDISDMTRLDITSTSNNLTYGIRKGMLDSGSNSVRIYWNAGRDINDYTDYVGGFTDATHTYSQPGEYIVAITDDISSLSITGGSSTASYTPNSKMLRKVTTGLKVTTMPSPGGGADEAILFDNGNYHLIDYINLRNVTRADRPAWKTRTNGGTLVADGITHIESYGVESSYGWNFHCDSLTSLGATATNGITDGADFWFRTKTCEQILSLINVLRTDLRGIGMLRFHGTDGYVHWDADAGQWVVVYSAKSYVQDGLIAMWDGIENAGRGVHDAAATTWKDLIGTNDLNDIVSNNNDWDWTANGFRQKTGNTCRFRRLGTTINWLYAEIVVVVGNKDRRSHFGGGANNGFANYFQYFTATAQNTPVPYVSSSGAAMTVGYDSVAQRMYKNGVIQTYNTISAGNYNITGEIYIGDISGNNTVDSCEVYNVRLYSRALTAEEIAHNYAIDKVRFNLQ